MGTAEQLTPDAKTFTDTERLDWALGHTGGNFDFDRDGKHWITWFQGSTTWVVYGKSWRECIDSALRGEAKDIHER